MKNLAGARLVRINRALSQPKPTKANPYAESAAGRGQWQAI